MDFDGGYGGGRGRGGGRSGFRGTAENAKTKLCTRWLEGDCRFGDRCNFAHGETELRQLPEGGRGEGGGMSYGSPRGGRGGYGGRGGPGRGFGGGRGYGGYPQQQMGGYQAGYGMQPQMQGGFDPRAASGVMQGQDPAWAAQGFPVDGPNGWCMYLDKASGEPYYHNHRTNETVWDKPVDWHVGM